MVKRLSVLACLLACAWGVSTQATSASRPAAVANVAATPVQDVVLARRNLMAAVGRNMDGISGMIEPGGTLEPADAAEHADEIAVMLMAFPHLFPAGSNNWSVRLEHDDPARVTLASPRVWRETAAFNALAQAASQQATGASRAADAAQFRLRIVALQASCDACHAQFRREEKPYSIPIPAPR